MDFDEPVPKESLYGVLKSTASKHPDNIAYEYFEKEYSYTEFLKQVDDFSLRLKSRGIGFGDSIVICLPNCPQAIISFYAASRLGARAVMVHPMSPRTDIEYSIRDSGAKLALAINKFYGNFPSTEDIDCIDTVIVTTPADCMPFLKRTGAKLVSKDCRMPDISGDPGAVTWSRFMSENISDVDREMPEVSEDAPAAILYTGGTTGVNKGAIISSRSFNRTAEGMIHLSGIFGEGNTMLAELPMFHGFGLCTCVHLPVCAGLKSLLMPTFTMESLAKTIVERKVNFIAGVPTLYEKLIEEKSLANADLSHIKGLFCGGDSMSVESKAKVDAFLKSHRCDAGLRIGYGCTECLTATAIMPKGMDVAGSVGVPIPGHEFTIRNPETGALMPVGENGEICITGPALMEAYLNNDDETRNVLRTHEDGNIWLHTGDLGRMDENGFIYFIQRIKRIIVTSGYNVFPS